MYYDVVASICTETERKDSHLICGGFNTEEEAMDYINVHNVSEVDYYRYCEDYEVVYIDIEDHDDEGGLITIIETNQ